MMDLDRALADITAIRSQIARGAVFRGYGPVTVAATGFLAMAAAALQALWLPEPASDVFTYLILWLATAVASIVLIGIEMVARTRRIHSGLADEMIHAATEQFIPAGVAGVLLTVVLFRFAPEDSLWMLPGLWQIVFCLLPFAAAPDAGGGSVVPRRRPRESRGGGRSARLFALCDGSALRDRTTSHRWRALFAHRRE
jgi:hypothetical protein